MAGVTVFRSLAGIISGPVAFLSSSPDNFLRTSSSVISLKLKLVETGVIWHSEVEGNGTATELKCCTKVLTMLAGSIRVFPSQLIRLTALLLVHPKTKLSCLQVDFGFAEISACTYTSVMLSLCPPYSGVYFSS